MKNIAINSYLFLAFVCLCSFAYQNNDNNLTFDQFLYPAIDSITHEYYLKGKILVLQNSYPDNKGHKAINNAIIKANNNGENGRIKLLKRLDTILDDSVRLNISNKGNRNYLFYSSQIDIKTKVDFNSPDFFGGINLSNVAYSEDGSMACFYIALQCGIECGGGYIVVLEKTHSKWSLSDIIQIWQ